MKAKLVSLIGQIVAALWIAFWSGKKLLSGDCPVSDIIYSGVAIAACFSPVYFNMFLDNVKNIRFGDGGTAND